MKGKIYVTKIATDSLVEIWDPKNGPKPSFHYVTCNSAGVIDWKKAYAFTPDELIARNNYQLVDRYEPMIVKDPLFQPDEKL